MLRSRLALWLSIFIFPPLALVLLWMRGDLGVLRRMAGTLGICVVAIVELFYVYGMQILWDGNVKPYRASFANGSRHDALVEATRARQRVELAQPTAPVETANSLPPATASAHAKSATAAPVAMKMLEKAVPAGYWTDFRGPNRAGVYAEAEIETVWPPSG